MREENQRSERSSRSKRRRTANKSQAATELYGTVFKPTIHREIYPFEELPRAIQEMGANVQTGIPIVRVAGTMSESVRRIAP